MPLSLLNHSALALFAQRTRIPTSARSIGFCAIWVCISSSSKKDKGRNNTLSEVICVCACGMYLRVPEGSIWRLPSDHVGGV